jgi:hypothetical protein
VCEFYEYVRHLPHSPVARGCNSHCTFYGTHGTTFHTCIYGATARVSIAWCLTVQLSVCLCSYRFRYQLMTIHSELKFTNLVVVVELGRVDACRMCCYQLPMGLSDLSGCNSLSLSACSPIGDDTTTASAQGTGASPNHYRPQVTLSDE